MNGPRVLGEQPMVEAGRLSEGAEVRNGDVPELTTAGRYVARLIILSFKGGARCSTVSTRGSINGRRDEERVRARFGPGLDISDVEEGCWLVIALCQTVGEPVQLIAELKVVRSAPSTLEPGQILVKLDGFIGIACGVVLVVGSVKESIRIREASGQRCAKSISNADTAIIPERELAGSRETEIVVILEVIAEASGRN